MHSVKPWKFSPEKDAWVFTTNASNILQVLAFILRNNYGYKTKVTKDYVYAYPYRTKPETCLMLVAHVDTIHSLPPTQASLFYDNVKRVLWSPNGLGADDRAGVLGILWLLAAGYRPTVLFPDGEEKGCVGSDKAVRDIKHPRVRAIIGLDRKGVDDAVYYNCDNLEFEDWVTSFGYKTDEGSFSDISILCPVWGIAGANLSVGYANAHTYSECLYLDNLYSSMRRVEQMLLTPPAKKQVYLAKPHYYRTFNEFPWLDIKPKYKYNEVYFEDTYKSYLDINICIDAAELTELYGGTVTYWAGFFEKYKPTLRSAAEKTVYEDIDHLIITEGVVLDA